MTKTDLVQRYRHLRRIAGKIQEAALEPVPHGTILEFGRRLGVVRMGELWVVGQELKLVQDLAIHTARPGRSRTIDRYARCAAMPPDSDEGRVLAALRQARFTMFKIETPHPAGGAMARDLLLKRSFHLMDVSIGLSAPPGFAFAGRLAAIEGFRMSCLTVMPLQRELLEHVSSRLPWPGRGREIDWYQDPRCAVTMYRSAIDLGTMRRCVTFDVIEEVPTMRDIAAVMDISDRRSVDLPVLTEVD
ncbi:MAG TPA: hypothetical protein VND19_07355 [Acetobacteraceae bacterium]|nr:hypothetical protein [Acetobacteraceae bacterium]